MSEEDSLGVETTPLCDECGAPVDEHGCYQSTPLGPIYYCSDHCPYGHDHSQPPEKDDRVSLKEIFLSWWNR